MYLILVTRAQVDCRYVCTSKARVEGVHTHTHTYPVCLTGHVAFQNWKGQRTAQQTATLLVHTRFTDAKWSWHICMETRGVEEPLYIHH